MLILEKDKAIEWLNEISLRPTDFTGDGYTANETELLAMNAIELLENAEETEFIYSDRYVPICKRCGFKPFAGYIPTLEWMKERGYSYCPGCGRKVNWND